jgi:hypothetical protein
MAGDPVTRSGRGTRIFDALLLASDVFAPLVAALNAQALFVHWRLRDELGNQ